MRKILLFQLLLVIFLITVFETVSYGSDKFSGYYNQAIEYYKQGKYDQAGKQFEKALELKPNDAYALYGLGNTYYCKAKYDEAIKIYTKAINSNPDYAKVHYSLSLAYNKMGMTQEAEKEKKIFRKISQGEKGRGKSSTSAKTSRSPVKVSESVSTIERSKSEFGLTKDKHADQEKSEFDTARAHGKTDDTDKSGHSAGQTHAAKETPAFSSKRGRTDTGTRTDSAESVDAANKTHAFSKKAIDAGGGDHHTGESAGQTIVESRDATDKHVISTRGTKKQLREEDTHTIFQGYTKESSKSKSNLFVKKQGKPYGYDISPVVYVKSKWSGSKVNKILVCVIGYVFVTQIWLSIIAFFGFIVWRIRKKNLIG
ncbi:MAG: tetratricopeptide repeat protein [Candidatus Scalindua sp.]|nr:tetratricopeptide repeat protein [Candidatus Scalindua sp.]